MSNRLRGCLVPLLFSCLVFAVTLEAAARIIVATNADGGRFLLTLPLRPFRLPVEETRAALALYEQTTLSELIYDPLLGWTNRPNMPDYNAAGLRADRDYSLDPPQDTYRIALFGDSFTHGNEVERGDSWAYQLERLLNQRGIRAEVLNFGVGGYGLDQAYLRWQHQGRAYRPDLVIVGFVEVDVARMVSLYWKFQAGALRIGGTNPFTKPRFVQSGEGLRLLNSPTIPPADIPTFLANFPQSEFVPYEAALDPNDYANEWWQGSYALALVDAVSRYVTVDLNRQPVVVVDFGQVALAPDGEADQLALALLRQWETEVVSAGGRFALVHLPLRGAVERHQIGKALDYAGLLRQLSTQYDWIETLDDFPTEGLAGAYMPGGHYSPSGGEIVAQAVADWLINPRTPQRHSPLPAL